MTVTINETNSVYSTTGTAMSLTTSEDITVESRGHIISTAGDALALSGASQNYNVTVSGTLASYFTNYAGLSVVGADSTSYINVTRGGTIHGQGQGIYLASNASITNDGSITSSQSADAAISCNGASPVSIINTGLIANELGYAIRLGVGQLTVYNYGIIGGGSAAPAIYGFTGGITLYNNGIIKGDLDLGGAVDTVTTLRHIQGDVHLGGGNDIFDGSGENDIVFGGADDDTIYGNGNNDTLSGDAGNDTINGGSGNDQLTGGDGSDTLIVDSADDVIIETAAGTGTDTVSAKASFVLAADDHIEILQAFSAVSTDAINLRGNALLAQSIYGNNGVNVLDGGSDSLSDVLKGYNGNDVYVIRSVNDDIKELTGGGTNDRARCAVSFTLQSDDDIEVMETIDARATTALNLTGNGLAQRLIGNAGANTLTGNGGNDTLAGGKGNDRLSGGSGFDKFVFDTALGSNNRDNITDFSAPSDVIHLENALPGTFRLLANGVLSASAFKANAQGIATDADDRIVYNTATGALFYDFNGSAAGGAIQFATLSTKPAITHADFFVI